MNLYINELEKLSQEAGITVITGMRFVGKSTLMKNFAVNLRQNGVSADNIIIVDFDGVHYGETCDTASIGTNLNDRLTRGGDVYLFLDELRTAAEFEATVGNLYLNKRLHIYIISSWRGLLARELSTVLSAGFRELEIFPMTMEATVAQWRCPGENTGEMTATWESAYLSWGGLPGSVSRLQNGEEPTEYLTGVLNTILIKDVLLHNDFRDVDFLLKLLGYIYCCGNEMPTAERILREMTTTGKKPHFITVAKYLTALREAGLIFNLPRYDVKKDRVLSGTGRWYATDMGLRELILGKPDLSSLSLWENLVCLELRQRGFPVYAGRLYAHNITVAARGTRPFYLQLVSVDQIQKATRLLKSVPDQYPKYVLTVEEFDLADDNGVMIMDVRKFLRGDYVL